MKSYLKFATHLFIAAAIIAPLAAPSAFAAEEPEIVRAKTMKRGASSPTCQFYLEAKVGGGRVLAMILIAVEDRPEYADYNKGRIKETGEEVQVILLHREASVGVEGVREIVGAILPEALARAGVEEGFTVELDGSIGDTLRIRLTRNYLRSFFKKVDAAVKKS